MLGCKIGMVLRIESGGKKKNQRFLNVTFNGWRRQEIGSKVTFELTVGDVGMG